MRLWPVGGRHDSLFMALQREARHGGMDTPVYGLAPMRRIGRGLRAKRLAGPAGSQWRPGVVVRVMDLESLLSLALWRAVQAPGA